MKAKRHLWLKSVFIAILLIGSSTWVNINHGMKVEAASITQPTPINKIFPDPALAEVIRSNLGKANVTDTVTQTDLDRLTILAAGGAGIKTIEGVQYLSSLTSIYLNDNQISDISELADLTNLNWLVLWGNQISDIGPLANLTNIGRLYLSDNQISDISPLANLTNIIWLEANNNNLSDISVLANLTKLERIYLNNNELSDLSALKNLTSLTNIEVTDNQISDISPLASLTKLRDLKVTNQTFTNSPINFQSTITIPNAIKDATGALIAPSTISNNGSYASPDITWNLPSYVSEVSYSFSQSVTIGNATGTFSGTITQPLNPALYTVSYHIDGTETSEQVQAGSLLTEPATPVKPGHNFIGWFDKEVGGNKWDFATDYMPANNLALYAQFNVASYTATFDIDGTTTTQKVNYQDLIQEPTSPTKEGYTFKGWYDAKTGGNKWDFATNKMPDKDLTLYAQFDLNNYDVTLDSNGTTTTQKVNYGELIPEPPTPTKPGYSFTGWYTAKTGGDQWDFATDKMPAKNLTLYAQFTINSYTATLDVDGTTTTQKVDYDSLIPEPTSPTKEGYTFKGWYDAKTGGKKWDFTADKMPASNLTLYAQFTINSYTATLDVDGTTTTQKVDYDSLIQEPTSPTKEGYTFKGWYDAKTGGKKWDFTADKMPANNLTLYAQFTINSYTATLDVDGNITTQKVDYQGLLKEPFEPTKPGYTFKGWFDTKIGGNKWDFAADKMPAKDITLYAQFSANSYTVTMDIDGKTTTQTVGYNELLPEPPTPKKEGYSFKGWYDAETGGKKWDFTADKMPENDLTLYAQFTINSYTATLENDGSTTTQKVDYQGLLKEPTEPTKSGYTFRGWYDAKIGGNKWDFTTDKMPAKDITLYAQYSVNIYTAIFDVDGKTITQKVDYQGLLKEPNAPIKAGYTFKGWYDAKIGGNEWDFTTDKMPASDIVLYAQFAKNPVTPPTPGKDTPPASNVGGSDTTSSVIITESNSNTLNTQSGNSKSTTSNMNTDDFYHSQGTALPTTGDSDNAIYILLGLLALTTAFAITKKVRANKR
ncbi:InlB B-repeat-containing protein [Listeria ivanovii]|uniref:InlB B-repeat-containing protein n=1 Tax=Listeria ivanovii TaxID=1638 RepID=UPI003CEB79F6